MCPGEEYILCGADTKRRKCDISKSVSKTRGIGGNPLSQKTSFLCFFFVETMLFSLSRRISGYAQHSCSELKVDANQK